MDVILDIVPGPRANRIMLVMLPGARDRPEDLVERGFVRALRDRGLPVDVAVAGAKADYYLERTVTARLAKQVVGPLRARCYRRIWFMGISLGAMGSAAYAREHAGAVEGIILIAPFLGTRGLIAEVTRAGGLERWQPGRIDPEDDERQLAVWLKAYRPDAPHLPKICLGYGTDDRFAPASAMLAQKLPAAQVVTIQGGHDWPTWTMLWERLLDRNVLGDGDK